MRLLFCIHFVLSLVYHANAQYINTSSEDALAIKNRILLVALPEEDKYIVGEYEQDNRPQHLQSYRDDLAGQRYAFEKIVRKYWKFTDSTVFMPLKEAKSLMKANENKYALLHYADRTPDITYLRKNYYEAPTVCWSVKSEGYLYSIKQRYNNRMLNVTSLVIDLPKRVVEVFLPKMSPSESDFITAMHHMNYMLYSLVQTNGNSVKSIYKSAPQKASLLKDKILLLDSMEMDRKQGLNNLEAVKKYYPYPVELTNYATIEKVMHAENSQYAIVTNARYDLSNSITQVSNAGDGTLYFNLTDATFEYGNIDVTHPSIQVYYPAINKTKLQQYANEK